jgi:hypothetical protein
VVCLIVLNQHLPGQTEENHKNLNQNNKQPSRDSNWVPSEYKSGALFEFCY